MFPCNISLTFTTVLYDMYLWLPNKLQNQLEALLQNIQTYICWSDSQKTTHRQRVVEESRYLFQSVEQGVGWHGLVSGLNEGVKAVGCRFSTCPGSQLVRAAQLVSVLYDGKWASICVGPYAGVLDWNSPGRRPFETMPPGRC